MSINFPVKVLPTRVYRVYKGDSSLINLEERKNLRILITRKTGYVLR